jgi:membrane protease YdiL (CAAX protease family)
VSAVLATGLCAAVALRVAAGGPRTASSLPAALVFVAAIAVVVASDGRLRIAVTRSTVITGFAGGALLVAAWLPARGLGFTHLGADVFGLTEWSMVVVLVAVAEEALLRGALFSALSEWRGAWTALIVTSIAFALMHVPMYGWQAVPIDLAVGVFLGGLRVLSGSVTAPAMAHAVADLAGGWMT